MALTSSYKDLRQRLSLALVHFFGNLVSDLRRRVRARRDAEELSHLSDHLLKDVGLEHYARRRDQARHDHTGNE